MNEEIRKQLIRVRVNDSELKAIKEKSAGNVSGWLRELAIGAEAKPTRKAKPVNKELLFELNRIGVNLNQIARVINRNADSNEVFESLLALNSIDESLKILREIYS